MTEFFVEYLVEQGKIFYFEVEEAFIVKVQKIVLFVLRLADLVEQNGFPAASDAGDDHDFRASDKLRVYVSFYEVLLLLFMLLVDDLL